MSLTDVMSHTIHALEAVHMGIFRDRRGSRWRRRRRQWPLPTRRRRRLRARRWWRSRLSPRPACRCVGQGHHSAQPVHAFRSFRVSTQRAVLPPCWRCRLQNIAQHADGPAHIAVLILQFTGSQLAGGVAAQAAGPGALLLQPAQSAPPRVAGWQVDELTASGRKLRFPAADQAH